MFSDFQTQIRSPGVGSSPRPPTPQPALCARDPRLLKAAVPIRQPDWLPPAPTPIGVRASPAPALIGPSLSSGPLSRFPPLESAVIGCSQMPIQIGPSLHAFPSHPPDWLLSRHLSQLAGCDPTPCPIPSRSEPLRESDSDPLNPLTPPPTHHPGPGWGLRETPAAEPLRGWQTWPDSSQVVTSVGP